MKRIFVMDDNIELLEIMERVLKQDYIIFLKPDTDNVVEEIDAFKPDLIILDHSIGDMNSSRVMNELRAINPNFSIPVILFSAHIHLSELATEMGVDGYIEKPSAISHIREYVKNIIDKKK